MVVTKHIAIICNYKLLEDRVGGMDYFFWIFNNAAKEKGYDIDWFFPNVSSHGNYNQFKIIPTTYNTLENSVTKFMIKKEVKYSHIITHFVELCTSFYSDLKQLQPRANIIAVDHNPRPLKGYPVAKQLKKRVKGILYSRYIDRFIGVSDYTSEAILNDFGGFLKSKTQTIYNGVLIDDIITKSEERASINPKFLVVSHLRHSKGIQDLIKAVNDLPEQLKSNLKIDVYGEGPYEKELKKLLEFYKLESVFNFMGSNSSLNLVYHTYDYLLQPTHMECFSLSILESLAANIPVVTTSVGGNEEVISNSENGFIFEPKNISQLTQLLEDIITGKKRILINTRQQIENRFSIELMVKNHLQLLE